MMETLRERDTQLEKLWKQFGDVPMNPDTEKMEEPFMDFPAGTDREEIWHWFDERHSKGVAYAGRKVVTPMVLRFLIRTI